MAEPIRIIEEGKRSDTPIVAEGKALNTVFRIAVTPNAADNPPVRYETIKEALVKKANEVVEKAEHDGKFNWTGAGFVLRNDAWSRRYTANEICDILDAT
jgi:hypothetical protein